MYIGQINILKFYDKKDAKIVIIPKIKVCKPPTHVYKPMKSSIELPDIVIITAREVCIPPNHVYKPR